MKKIWISLSIIAIIVIIFIILSMKNHQRDQAFETVKVKRGTITVKALAVGEIKPRNEISVKSKIGGIITRLLVDVGDYVKKGDILAEVSPDPTPMELASLRREVELQEINVKKLKSELNRSEQLMQKNLISREEYEKVLYSYKEAQLRLDMLKEKLELVEKGKANIANTIYESVIKSPISGVILEKFVNVGDPVVPLTSYQAGTPLFTVADMSQLIFKGTIDEIDVGKVKEGMSAIIKIGALPEVSISGVVSKIAPKGIKKDNATLFEIEITLSSDIPIALRAGYSANAEIIIEEKKDILVLPERVVTFRNDSAFVKVPVGENKFVEKYIKTGISDGLSIEVVDGLKENDEVQEPPQVEIS